VSGFPTNEEAGRELPSVSSKRSNARRTGSSSGSDCAIAAGANGVAEMYQRIGGFQADSGSNAGILRSPHGRARAGCEDGESARSEVWLGCHGYGPDGRSAGVGGGRGIAENLGGDIGGAASRDAGEVLDARVGLGFGQLLGLD